MIKSKLMALLNSCSPEDLKGFKKHINKEEQSTSNVQKLYKYLISKRNQWNDERVILKDLVATKIYGTNSQKLKKLTNLMSELTLLLETFLMAVELEGQSDLKIQLQLRMYEKRGMDKYFERSAEHYLDKLEKKPQRDIAYYRESFLINSAIYAHPSFSKIQNKLEDMVSIHHLLDSFYFSSKMLYNFESLNRSELFREYYKTETNHFLYSYMDAMGLDQLPSVNVYKRLTEIVRNEDEAEFKILVGYIKGNLFSFNHEEQIDILQSLINLGTDFLHKGNLEYNNVIFDLYKIGLEENIWIYQGILQWPTFMNIVILSCSLKKMDWCINFIDDYSGYLKESNNTSVAILAKGYFHLKNREFGKALDYLRIAEYENVYHNVYARSWQLMCYYELEESYELAIYDYIKSFSEFIRRNKLLGESEKISIQNMIKFTGKIVKARSEKKRSPLKLKEEEQYFNRQWLEEKAKELSDK